MGAPQDDIFARGEADAWFHRNRAALVPRARDWPGAILGDHGLLPSIRSVLDVGAANGWRLATLRPWLPALERACGCDLSPAAVADGRARFPGLDLEVGPVARMPFEEPFDLVIVAGVFTWVDRRALARSVMEVDRLVAEGGHLLIADFRPDAPCRRRYHHRQDVELYTWKQDYPAIFEALGPYRRVDDRITGHATAIDDPAPDLATLPEQDRWGWTLLRKSLDHLPVVGG